MREHTTIYTIMRTGADADRGNFPPASAEGSFFSLKAAQAHMEKIVQQEKNEMHIPFDEADYREEQDETFWEAFQNDYANGWFVRYEIIESELMEESTT